MRFLKRLNINARDTLKLCIKSIRDEDLSGRLESVMPEVEAAELDYLNRAAVGEFYKISGTNGVAEKVTTAEMERVYDGTFVKSVKTRYIYDLIKKLPVNDICPLCNQRTVFTLDHFLPKSVHPALAVTTANLVPACDTCNKIKLDFEAHTAVDQTLHPYFDDVDDARWLFAKVNEEIPPSLIFSALPPSNWPEVKRQRVTAHFNTFRLGELYASHAAVELGNIRFGLIMMSKKCSSLEIREHLKERAISCADAQKNSWQTATYEALAESVWFCSGAFAS
jgi:hypothetical protein